MNPIHLNLEIFKVRTDLSESLIEELYNLDLKFFPTAWDFKSWNNLMLDASNLLIVLRNHEEIIGFSLFLINENDHFAHLLKILVIPNFRQQNLGRFLLSKSVMALNDIGISNIYLEVEQTNLSAQRLYEKSGFNIIHSKKDFYGSNRSAFIMTNYHD